MCVVLGEQDRRVSPARSLGIAVRTREQRLWEEHGLENALAASCAPAVVEAPYGGHRSRFSGSGWGPAVVDDDLRHRLTGRLVRPALNAAAADSFFRALEAREELHLLVMGLGERFHVCEELLVGFVAQYGDHGVPS